MTARPLFPKVKRETEFVSTSLESLISRLSLDEPVWARAVWERDDRPLVLSLTL